MNIYQHDTIVASYKNTRQNNNRKDNDMEEFKGMSLRLPKELWLFLKYKSIKTETSINSLIIKYIERAKKSSKKKLTKGDTTI